MNKIEGFSITWFINNYRNFWQRNNEAIVSPVFSIYMPEETKWNLLFFPRGTVSYADYVSFFLYRDKDCNGSESIEVEYNLEILDTDDSILVSASQTNAFRNDDRYGYDKYLYGRDFTPEKHKYLPLGNLTLRCRITKIAEKKVEIRQIYARTTFDVENQCCLVSIDNFSNLTPNQKRHFAVQPPTEKVLIYIDCYASKDYNNDDKIYFSMYSFDHRVKFSVVKTFIMDSHKQKVDSGAFECWFHNGKRNKFPLGLTKKQLMDNDCLYLPNDTLTVSFELTITFADEKVEKVNVLTWRKCIAQEKVSDSSCALIADLASMYSDQSLCDMKLQTKTNIFPVHTFMLSARSPVFKAMFSNEMKEKINGCVDVSDIDDEIVRRFLLYLYTDQLEDFKFQDALQLYKIADKYAVFSLIEKCSTFLKYNLNQENALEVLIFSDIHQDNDLKLTVQKWILRNAGIIFNSPEWKLFAGTNSELVIETMLLNWIEE